MDEMAMTTRGLTRRFGKTLAVDGLDLFVPRGGVFGFIGRNGAGKTTTIRMLLGLLSATAGEASVLGLDPARRGVEIRQRVGYAPERHHMYRWMTIAHLIRFVRPFYPTWDDAECERLLKRFGLDPARKVKALSKGMLAKTALTLALAHRPELLVLDEPTGGLDAVVRREFLESIVEMASDGERTVFLSSHLLADVERVADRVAVLHDGRLALQEPLDALKARIKKVRLRFGDAMPSVVDADGVLRAAAGEREWLVTVSNFTADTPDALKRRLGAESAEVIHLSLEDIFVELVGRDAGEDAASAA